MSDAEFQLFLVIAALATMVVAACSIQGIARVFLIAQAAYWGMSYVARPVVLLWVQPRPRFGDNIADPRLATIGYDHGIAMVLQPVVFGLWVYTLMVLAYVIWRRRRGTAEQPRPADPNFIPTLWVVYAIGLLGRAVSYVTGNTSSAGETQAASPLLSFVTLMAVMGSLGLIIFIRPASEKVTFLIIAGLTSMELLWTVVIESKTPILGAALAIAVRFSLTGWTRAKVTATGAIAILGIGAFGWLQSFKESATAKAESQILDSSYPDVVQPFLSILRRFDLLEAATDSYYLAGRPWISPGAALQNALQSLVPGQLLGTAKFHSGTAWARDVRGASVDMTRVSVSLAEGNINEGYVLGGYVGVIVAVTFTFLLLLAAVRALHARNMIFFVAVGLALTELPVLFERGILGSMEVLGKTLQVAVLIWIIYLFVGEYRRRNEKAPSTPESFRLVPDIAVQAKG